VQTPNIRGALMSIKKRILFIPDTINGVDSGAHSARATLNNLQALGYSVGIYSADANLRVLPDVKKAEALFSIPTAQRWYEFIFSPVLQSHFAYVVNVFKPDYVLFAGSIQKPPIIAREARKRGIRTVYLFYINDFFCHIIYAGTKYGPCNKCNSGCYLPALTERCLHPWQFPYWIKGSLTRYLLAREIRRSYRVLGYGNEQIDSYRRFKVPEEKLSIIGFQFDPSDLKSIKVSDDGYFFLTGQPIVQKGWHLLAEIFSYLSMDVKVKISIPDENKAKFYIQEYGLKKFIDNGTVEIVSQLFKRNDYISFVASARGVLLPSYYSTTGEFVLQESMYLGKPVHVFNVGVHKDILTDRHDALVSNIGDTYDYASKINEINLDECKRLSIGANARITSQKLYSSPQLDLLDAVFQ
jgi:glycosyltransferase involved in cell wall biosynthesis